MLIKNTRNENDTMMITDDIIIGVLGTMFVHQQYHLGLYDHEIAFDTLIDNWSFPSDSKIVAWLKDTDHEFYQRIKFY